MDEAMDYVSGVLDGLRLDLIPGNGCTDQFLKPGLLLHAVGLPCRANSGGPCAAASKGAHPATCSRNASSSWQLPSARQPGRLTGWLAGDEEKEEFAAAIASLLREEGQLVGWQSHGDMTVLGQAALKALVACEYKLTELIIGKAGPLGAAADLFDLVEADATPCHPFLVTFVSVCRNVCCTLEKRHRRDSRVAVRLKPLDKAGALARLVPLGLHKEPDVAVPAQETVSFFGHDLRLMKKSMGADCALGQAVRAALEALSGGKRQTRGMIAAKKYQGQLERLVQLGERASKTRTEGGGGEEGDSAGPTRICRHCSKPGHGMKACSKCKGAWYCSRDCQKRDWKEHKRRCTPYHGDESAVQNVVAAAIQEDYGRIFKAVLSHSLEDGNEDVHPMDFVVLLDCRARPQGAPPASLEVVNLPDLVSLKYAPAWLEGDRGMARDLASGLMELRRKSTPGDGMRLFGVLGILMPTPGALGGR